GLVDGSVGLVSVVQASPATEAVVPVVGADLVRADGIGQGPDAVDGAVVAEGGRAVGADTGGFAAQVGVAEGGRAGGGLGVGVGRASRVVGSGRETPVRRVELGAPAPHVVSEGGNMPEVIGDLGQQVEWSIRVAGRDRGQGLAGCEEVDTAGDAPVYI